MAGNLTQATGLMDESFDASETNQYGLGMILGTYRFTCCVIDFRRNKLLGLQHFIQEDPLAQVVDFHALFQQVTLAIPWLNSPFRIVKIAYDGAKATLVPSIVFQSDEREEYFKFNHRMEADEVVAHDHLMPLDAWQVYTLPEQLPGVAGAVFPRTRIVHLLSLLVESVWINYKNRIKTPHIFLHIRKPLFDVMVFDGRQMSYFNTFRFQVPEDLIYYLIFIMEQLELNPEVVPVVLLGDIEEGEGIYELMYKYIRHLTFASRNDAYSYSYCLNRIPDHFHYPLLNFFSCGL